MRMGQDGVALVKPDQNGGLDLATTEQSTNGGDIETMSSVPNVEPNQTDYDIYDEVTEIKIN